MFCHCRPLSKAETSAGCSTVVDFESARDGELGFINSGLPKKTFKFDRVFTPKDDQGKVAFVIAISQFFSRYKTCFFLGYTCDSGSSYPTS